MVKRSKRTIFKILMIIFLISLYFITNNLQLPGVQDLSISLRQEDITISKEFSFVSLGVMPYIIADMIIYVLSSGISPLLTGWKREGLTGCRKLNICKCILMMISAYIYAMANIKNAELMNQYLFISRPEIIALVMAVGTIFTMLICKLISKTKIVNGLNLMLFFIVSENILRALLRMQTSWEMYLMVGIIALFVIIGIYLDSKWMKIKVDIDNSDIAMNESSISIPYNPIGITPFLFISVVLQLIKNKIDSSLVFLIYFFMLYVIIGIWVGWRKLGVFDRCKMMQLNGIYIVTNNGNINPGDDTYKILKKLFKRVIIINLILSLLYFTAFTIIASHLKADVSVISVFLLAILFEQLFNDFYRYSKKFHFETL
ncbi:SecY family transport protein [[Clostridium] innocuum]|nr:SecY family transport protein [[Clostridium] innocuum]MCR0603726.1 SecY family transport protein [[Clostridium] innocuum]